MTNVQYCLSEFYTCLTPPHAFCVCSKPGACCTRLMAVLSVLLFLFCHKSGRWVTCLKCLKFIIPFIPLLKSVWLSIVANIYFIRTFMDSYLISNHITYYIFHKVQQIEFVYTYFMSREATPYRKKMWLIRTLFVKQQIKKCNFSNNTKVLNINYVAIDF